MQRISCLIRMLGRWGFVVLFSSVCHAQFDIVWQRVYGSADQNYPGRAIELSNGNILVAGTVSDFDANSDFEITVLSSTGDSLETHTYGGTLPVAAYDVFRLMDNRCVVAGIGVAEETNETDFMVVTTTQSGVPNYVRDFYHEGNDILRDGVPTSNNQILLAGQTEGGSTGVDFFVARLDSELSTSWSRRIANVGLSRDAARSVVEMNANAIYVGGSTHRLAFPPTDRDMYLVKLNSQGDSLWSMEFGGDAWEEIITMEPLNDHQLVLAANRSDDNGDGDILVVCVDTVGNILWETPIGNANSEELASDILVVDDEIFVLGTKTGSDGVPVVLIVGMNRDGDTLWTQTITGETGIFANSIELLSDGEFLVCATTYSMAIPPQSDAVVMRLAYGSEAKPERPEVPAGFDLTVYPNPFNSTLSIALDVPLHQEVSVALYDLLGREVEVIYRGRLTAATLSYAAPASLSSGVYFVRAVAGNRAVMGKVVLLR